MRLQDIVIKIYYNGILKEVFIKGYIINDILAIHRAHNIKTMKGMKRYWVVTHIPSKLKVHKSHFNSFAKAKQVMDRLSEIVPWDKVTECKGYAALSEQEFSDLVKYLKTVGGY